MKQLFLLFMGLLLVACSRSEPTVPLPHEMPPLETAVPFQVLPVSHSLLSPTDLDGGWHGAACPGPQPFFCLYEDGADTAVASLSFAVFPLFRNQIMQEFLAQEVLALGHTPQPEDEAYIRSARAVLTALADSNLAEAEQNAGPEQTVSALPRQPVAVGPLPGLAFGHMVQNQAGEVVDYVRLYAAFDGDVLYWLRLSSGETTIPPEALETTAVNLLAQLALPPPVVDSDLERVRADLAVSVTAVLGEGFIQHLTTGQTVTVIGQSLDGNWLYITCPENSQATSCWIPNDSGRVRPR